MSSDDVELVRTFLEAYERGGNEAVAEFVHPGFEMVQLPLHPESGSYRGMQAADSVAEWRGAFDDFHAEAEEIVEVGGQVVASVRERGKVKDSGFELDQLYGALFTLRDGRIARLEWFHDPEDALKAAAPAERQA